MAVNKDSITNTLIVAIGLCLVCATCVSVAAVGLRSMQQENKLVDKKKNILSVAGLLDGDPNVKTTFDAFIIDRIIDLESGQDVTDEYDNPSIFDQIDVAESKEEGQYRDLEEDPATIKTQETRSHVYIVKTSVEDETPVAYVFPIRGKGLWTVLKGFVALEADLKTIRGITYYEHGETPGLGGEVDNANWKQRWQGKVLFDPSGKVAMKLLKSDWQDNPHAVDTLSGATITSRGVEKMLSFWMSDTGFGPYLKTLNPKSITE